MKILYSLLSLLLLANIASSQDTNKVSLKEVFTKSTIQFHARTMAIGTINEGSLKDDYAIGAGIGAGITTKSFHGFQLGFSSFVTYNLSSSSLTQVDSLTLSPNRYELGMFDLMNPNDKVNLIRIEQFFLKYNFSKSSIALGKMKLNTPFINPQDGRLNTTLEEGIWLAWDESKKIKF